MSDNFVGEIRPVGFNFAPRGWALCNGQILPISQNTALFSLLGTYYGGNGTSTFALPNLQGRMPIAQGQGTGLSPYSIGEAGGTENVTLLSNQLAGHTHTLPVATIAGTSNSPSTGTFLAQIGGTRVKPASPAYSAAPAAGTFMATGSVALKGNSQPHNNMMPYLVINYVIALTGIFPSRN